MLFVRCGTNALSHSHKSTTHIFKLKFKVENDICPMWDKFHCPTLDKQFVQHFTGQIVCLMWDIEICPTSDKYNDSLFNFNLNTFQEAHEFGGKAGRGSATSAIIFIEIGKSDRSGPIFRVNPILTEFDRV